MPSPDAYSGPEVETLWRNAGAGGPLHYDPAHESYAANYEAARLLVSLLGCTSYLLNDPCDDVDQNWHIARFYKNSSPVIEELALVDYFGYFGCQ